MSLVLDACYAILPGAPRRDMANPLCALKRQVAHNCLKMLSFSSSQQPDPKGRSFSYFAVSYSMSTENFEPQTPNPEPRTPNPKPQTISCFPRSKKTPLRQAQRVTLRPLSGRLGVLVECLLEKFPSAYSKLQKVGTLGFPKLGVPKLGSVL